ncbi:MAG: TCP-1/cpn60 chaperonin family protein, partial [Candidatus Eiseniibacteriota bacterium]
VGSRDAHARVLERAARLEREASESASRFDRERIEERRARLVGGLAVLRIGGATAPELRDRRSRAEDAVHAVRAAIAEGIVPGGGVALARSRDAVRALGLEGDAAHGARIVLQGMLAPAWQIADNAGEEAALIVDRILESHGSVGYDAALGRFADLFRAGVVDPTRVVRVALQNAASIAGLLLTTDVLVVEDDDGSGPGPDLAGPTGPAGPSGLAGL